VLATRAAGRARSKTNHTPSWSRGSACSVCSRAITKVRAAILCDGRHRRRPLTSLSEHRAGQSVTSRDDHERIFALRLADDLSYRPRKNDQPRSGSGARKSAPVSRDSADKKALPPDDRNEMIAGHCSA
jgi:hypothetical protein